MSSNNEFVMMFETFDLSFELPEMKKILKDEMCNCFNIWPPVNKEMMSFFRKNKKYSAASFLPASTLFLGNLKKHTSAGRNIEPTVKFASDEIGKLDEIQRIINGDVYWIAFPECDSSQLPVYLYENRIRYKNRRDAYEKILAYFQNWDVLKKIGQKRKCKIMGIAGHPGTIPMLCDMGMDACLTEMCISALYDIYPTISMTRGVSRQHSKKWGLDFSHWTTYAGPTIYNNLGKRIAGWSESYWERNLYIGYLSGADIFRIEEVAARHTATKTADAGKNFCFIVDKKNNVKFTPLGKVLKKFADFTSKKLKDRGEPYLPVAFMTDKTSGWNPRNSSRKYDTVFHGQFPYNAGDYMNDHFMNLVYEGHHKHGNIEGAPYAIRRDYDDGRWEFAEKDKAKELSYKLIENGFDTRPFESLSTAVYGDSFDFITTEAENNTIDKYKLIIPLGEIKFPLKARTAITEFVKNGGTLLLNAKEAAQWDSDFTGVRISGKTDQSCVSKCLICGRSYEKYFSYETGNNSELWYEYSEMIPISATVRAINDNNAPLITENKYGNGKVYVMAPHYCSGSIKPNLMCRIAEHFFRHLMDEFIPVKITPADISFSFNKNDDGYILGLFNNNNFDWSGKIEVQMKDKKSKMVLKSLVGKDDFVSNHNGENLIIKTEIKKFSFRILELTNKSR